MRDMSKSFLRAAYAAVLTLGVGACGITTLNPTHPLWETHADVAAANIYFIRPFTYRERGYADNAVKIDLNGTELMSLGKGEYTLARIKPDKATIATRNLSMFTNKDQPIEMTRNIALELTPGQTYFLHIKQINEEFRGVYYSIEPVDLPTAKALADRLKAIGPAKQAPLDSLDQPS